MPCCSIGVNNCTASTCCQIRAVGCEAEPPSGGNGVPEPSTLLATADGVARHKVLRIEFQ